MLHAACLEVRDHLEPVDLDRGALEDLDHLVHCGVVHIAIAFQRQTRVGAPRSDCDVAGADLPGCRSIRRGPVTKLPDEVPAPGPQGSVSLDGQRVLRSGGDGLLPRPRRQHEATPDQAGL